MSQDLAMQISSDLVREFDAKRNSSHAWKDFSGVVRRIMSQESISDVMELGAGRAPSFDSSVLQELGVTYCSNDISQRELDLGPSWTKKARFDLCSQDPEAVRQFAQSSDLVFSKMLMEHVPDYRAAYRNISTILRTGGISIAFHPVLFSVPFVANRLLPEHLSVAILKAVFPNRNDDEKPKFPAVYSGCRISSSVRQAIMAEGFRSVQQIPFWGHSYYRKFPIIRSIHAGSSLAIERAGLTTFATYVFTVAVK
jgi:SAM-dependent methyltransferase